jgi:type IV secretory pathway VirJ component
MNRVVLATAALLTLIAADGCQGSTPQPPVMRHDATAHGPSSANATPTTHADSAAASDSLTFGRFGTVVLYRRTEHPSHVALFVSGDGGWNLGVVGMAQELASMDALVVGIDIRHYFAALARASQACSYPAADFEALSQYIQKRLGFAQYTPPVLVGYSSGATLVYATLAQAPPNTFRGAISLGFCPDLPLSRPLCRGSGLESKPRAKGKGYNFLPTALSAPWIALQGTADETCFADSTQAFVSQVKGGEIILLPKVGHGFGVTRRWVPQFRDAFARIVSSPVADRVAEAPAVRDLPLIEEPASGGGTTLAVIVSGDGGWASIDRQIGGALAARGISVVGLNSLQYFWKGRTPDEAARDLERILRHYMSEWGKSRAIVVGYSFGADVAPFMLRRLPNDLRAHLRLVALLGVSRTADFEFHLSDWLGGSGGSDALPTLPEIRALRRALDDTPILCFYGAEEHDTVCKDLEPSVANAVALGGGHHFGGDYTAIAERIVQAAR